jgi:hypothetical protein
LANDFIQNNACSYGDVQRRDLAQHGKPNEDVAVLSNEAAQTPMLAP